VLRQGGDGSKSLGGAPPQICRDGVEEARGKRLVAAARFDQPRQYSKRRDVAIDGESKGCDAACVNKCASARFFNSYIRNARK
jgi:hypothetical protein